METLKLKMIHPDPGAQVADLAGMTAESMIQKIGFFLPFGVGLNRDLNPVLFVKDENGRPLPMDLLSQAMQEEGSTGRLIAAAVVAILPLAPPASEFPQDVIALQIEVPGKSTVVLGRTFRKGLLGYNFGEPFVIDHLIAEEVFAPARPPGVSGEDVIH